MPALPRPMPHEADLDAEPERRSDPGKGPERDVLPGLDSPKILHGDPEALGEGLSRDAIRLPKLAQLRGDFLNEWIGVPGQPLG